ncbi:hypothetical protein IJ818_01850 [bacterium]|nr:hypothetical protein [bacterium]
MYIRLRISDKIFNILFIIFTIILIIVCSKLVFDYYYDQYIINTTEQTFHILQKAYYDTINITNFNWAESEMDTGKLAKEFIKNLPLKQNCKYNGANKCFYNKVHFKRKIKDSQLTEILISDYYKVELKNNTGIAFKILSPDCSQVRERCGNIFIDVNGPNKGPNMLSEDIYDFGIYKDGIKLYILEANHIPNCLNGTGQGCAAYMFRFRNRNYKSFKKYIKKYNLQNVNMGD